MGGNIMTAGRKVNTLSQSWCTPSKYIDAIKLFWNGKIDLDPCSNQYSIVKAEKEFMLPETDGLQQEWNYHTIYVNPPYGTDRSRGTSIKNWLAKCAQSHKIYQSEVIALIPVAPNTLHWKKYVFGQASSICFLYDTRLRFLENGIDSGKGAPMACCLVYWGNRIDLFFDNFIQYGAVVNITNLQTKSIGSECLYSTKFFNEKTERTNTNEKNELQIDILNTL